MTHNIQTIRRWRSRGKVVYVEETKKLKILIYAPCVGRGGMHLVVERLSRAWAELSTTDNSILSFTVLGQRLDENGEEIHWPEQWTFIQLRPGDGVPRHPRLFEYLTRNRDVFAAHLEELAPQFDVIFCPSVWWSFNASHWKVKTPVVTLLPDFAFDHIDMGVFGAQFRREAKTIAARAAVTVFPSEFQRQHGVNNYGFSRTKVIKHSSDFVGEGYNPTPEEAERVRTLYGLPDRFVLAFHCYGHKDPFTILNGLHRARSTSAHVPVLVIAGIETEQYLRRPASNPHVEQFQRLMRHLKSKVGQDIIILGTLPQSDVAGLHAAATCAVQASRSEGDLSGGSFNAILAKCPLLYSTLPPVVERLGLSGMFGYPFQVGNDSALANALIACCENPALAKKKADAAFELLSARTVADVAMEYINVFRETAST